eukprot:gene26293-2951_t
MRDTWLKYGDTSRYVHRFVIGTKGLDADTMAVLRQEQSQYGDLGFLPNFKDAYNSLTQKLAESYKWAAT